jgi:hypothetical protein
MYSEIFMFDVSNNIAVESVILEERVGAGTSKGSCLSILMILMTRPAVWNTQVSLTTRQHVSVMSIIDR